MTDIQTRAAEIAAFLGIPESEAIARLSLGFHHQHKCVNDDFRRCNPRTDDELLNWYRTTTEYIWELSAYHLDPGFNYSGMCRGIVDRLKAEKCNLVLSLGDGIGDLTLECKRAGMDPFYHDLEGSKTAQFAQSRIDKLNATRGENVLRVHADLTETFEPRWFKGLISSGVRYDAVISLDFLEHVPNVEEWCRTVFEILRPGGLFCAQNAFDCGSGPDGAIPCHLSVNDKYAHPASEADQRALWDVLLDEIGFKAEGSNWYRKPMERI